MFYDEKPEKLNRLTLQSTELAVTRDTYHPPSLKVRPHIDARSENAAASAASAVFGESFSFERPAWQAEAACADSDSEDFFTERGESEKGAKEVCAGCDVRAQCLEFGLHEKFGIWGGLSERQRSAVRRQRRRAA